MRRLAAAVTIAAIGLLFVACTPEEADHLTAVNGYREANGAPPLAWEEALYAPARAWSQHMADTGQLSHPTSLALNFNPPPGWRKLGQNVAVASTLEGAMAALQSSAPHRANLLNREFTKIAVGVIVKDGRYWVTENFLG